MKHAHILTVLTIVNFAALIFLLLHHPSPVEANAPADVLRAHRIEIVDAKGNVRASLHVVPAGPARMADGTLAKDGKLYPETVRFQLIRADGRPSVKIATSEDGSGLSLGGGVDPTYIVINADAGSPYLSLTNKDGHQQLIKP